MTKKVSKKEQDAPELTADLSKVEVKTLGNLNDEKAVEEVEQENKQPKVDLRKIAEELQEKADKYKEEISNNTDREFLKAEEERIMKEMDEFDEHIKNVTYKLPDKVVFNGRVYDTHQISTKIVRFLNTKEVEWGIVAGMYQLVKLWINPPKELSYGVFDSTLRTLDTCKFKGTKEWEDILIINEYFTQCNDGYAQDNLQIRYLSTIHSHVMDRLQMIEPVENLEIKNM